MLSPEGYDIAWTQYQGYVVDKLNRLTAGTDMDFQDILPRCIRSDMFFKVPRMRIA